MFGVDGEGGATQAAVEQGSSSEEDGSDQENEVRGSPHATYLISVACRIFWVSLTSPSSWRSSGGVSEHGSSGMLGMPI